MMKNSTLIIMIATIIALVAAPMVFDEISAETNNHGEYTITVELSDSLNQSVTVKGLSGTFQDYGTDYDFSYTGNPDWLTIEAGEGEKGTNGMVQRAYIFTGIPDEIGDYTITITEQYKPLKEMVYHITTFHLHVVMPENAHTVTFNANTGTFEDGSSIMTMVVTGVRNLPEVTRTDGVETTGWYTEADGGEFIGLPGSPFTVTTDVTYYAHWESPTLDISSELIYEGQHGAKLEYSPTVTDQLGNPVTGFTITITKDETDCLVSMGDHIEGVMSGLLPGDYEATILVSKTGYLSDSQTLDIHMPVRILEDIEESIPAGETFSTTLNLKPDNAYISQYTVNLDGERADTGSYTASKNGKTFTITPEVAGEWEINLTLESSDASSASRTIRLDVTDGGQYDDTPTISSIRFEKSSSAGYVNTYNLYAVGVTNADTITWDFGDGTTDSGSMVTHDFSMGVWTVTCTVKNVNTNETAKATCTIEATDEENDGAYTLANIGAPYKYSFNIPSKDVKVEYSSESGDNYWDWLDYEVHETSEGAIITFSGTCNDSSLGEKSFDVRVTSGSFTVTWEIQINPKVDLGDDTVNASFGYSVSGRVVLLKDFDPDNVGIRLQIDWGDGKTEPISITKDFEGVYHTYSQNDTYSITVQWVYKDLSGTHSFDDTQQVSVGDGAPTGEPSVIYVTLAGTGTMAPQTGALSYTVKDCGFENGDAEFLGWNTSATFTGDTYMPGDTITPSGPVTLYAMWSNADTPGDDTDILVIVAVALIILVMVVVLVRQFL